MSPAGRRWVRNAAIVLAAGWALAALGPFGTYSDLTTLERHGYWIGLTLAMWLQIEAAHLALRRLWPGRRTPRALDAAVAAAVGAAPTTFEVAYVEGLLRVGGVLTPRSMLETYASVLIIAVGLYVPLSLLQRRRALEPAAAPLVGDDDPLPPELRGEVIALAAEDHYLRVFRPGGQALIHHRFSDAVQAMGERGVQVHRSWWVAKSAVAQAEREGDRHVLRLTGGLRVPVSRTFGLAARQAGLIPRD